MKLDQLRRMALFAMVAREGSFTAVAQQQNIATSAISSVNWKFSAVGWFPLAKPIPDLHFTVKHTVRNFRRSGLIP